MYQILNCPANKPNVDALMREFECQHCKPSCCTLVGGIALHAEEVPVMAQLMGVSKKQFKEHFTYVENKKRHMIAPCPFYDEEKRCTIHDKRPKMCREFPINRADWDGERYWLKVNTLCPGGKKLADRWGVKL